eukprot:g22695.t1
MGRGKEAGKAPEAEYDVLILQSTRVVIVALEEAQNGHVTQELRGGIKMVGELKVLPFVVYRVQMLYQMISKSMFSLTNVEETTSGAADI